MIGRSEADNLANKKRHFGDALHGFEKVAFKVHRARKVGKAALKDKVRRTEKKG